ncbi:UDP-N-acetylmuramoyl-tripeptide--D-alanyl-D- alanine ligase [Bifidobacterium moukalabense DSM 27321]|uniref:UDP-N-acetylmuramoyl-tripeptide--D-alanyl-D-alanine ligase n=2 Tax=Bifidobacterium moukalabense TaxID=1333651 RepID=W4NC75_9BIFI|nr:UDP-N-acetylmuramoyl-tripeptide--D-alanyl-D- alanine ligase [Bifidobacterium moukalabense DSM 27321]
MNSNPTMMPMSLAEIAQAVHGRLVTGETASNGVMATSAFSDSRQVREGSVFVAIAGERVDGHDFVAKVGERGAVAALVDHEVADAGVVQIVVEDTVRALGELARHNLERRRAMDSPFTVIGITGSVGKTTTKDLMASLLSSMGETVAPVGSFNNEIGLPLTALRVNEGTRFLVAEMGANHVGEIANLTSLVPPDIAVVLKVGVAHLGEFGSAERIAQAKSEIVKGLVPGGVTVLNANDGHVAAMSGIAPGEVLWFGLPERQTPDHMVAAENVSCDDLDRPSFDLRDAEGEHAAVKLGICGLHNVMNALAAATVAHRLGMPLDRIAAGLADVRRISPHRMAVSTIAKPEAEFTLIDDSFNANPDSMKAGLDGLIRWHANDGRQPFRIAVLGAMLELGPDERMLHEQVGAYAVQGGVDALIAVGSRDDVALDALAEAMTQGGEQAARARCTVDWAHDIDQADALVSRLATEHAGTVVLLKGSHASGLSALADRWQPLATE